MAEKRVDLLHLLEDLRDAYPGSIEETMLTEIVANSIDAEAERIRILTRTAEAALTIVDNGSGMPRRDLRRYHDLATSTKTRGAAARNDRRCYRKSTRAKDWAAAARRRCSRISQGPSAA